MKIVKWGSREIKIHFDTKKIEEWQKKYNMGYVHAFIDKETEDIYIRKELSIVLKRIAFWHDLTHLVFDCLDNLSNETCAEINARFIDEILARNEWIIKEFYLLENKEKE